MMSGLFGLGSAVAGIFSDRALKRDVREVGRLHNGLPVYAYSYAWGGPEHIGLMADDVERVAPHAVGERDGFKTVNYSEAVL